MGKTPYNDLNSQNVLSAHVSGVQHDVNKLQEVLNMQTSSVTGHALNPVNDQEDPSLRYRIYEGSIRNWLDNPLPTIYRNGSVVASDEYSLQAPYGVIVFNQQQNSNDNMSADFSYINNDSKTINDIETDINSNNDRIIDLENKEIQLSGTRMFVSSGTWASHNADGFADLATNTAMAASLIDAFPFPVGHTMTLDRMAVRVDTGAGSTGAMAIYKDNQGYPDQLIIDGGTFDTSTTGWKENTIDVTLEPGMYWLVRNQDGSCAMSGFTYEEVIPAGMDIFTMPRKSAIDDGTADMRNAGIFGGLRGSTSAGLSGGFPQTFPSGITPFSRSHYCSIFVRRA
ncbi:hypothetical protein [Virgibacillus sp. CBA3643]|uniref:hypothetical protein n=1 Tax=Virgibacillus sp. CBA3643 TaxID=2942278 RepID=UPI0035A2E05D